MIDAADLQTRAARALAYSHALYRAGQTGDAIAWEQYAAQLLALAGGVR